MRVCIIVEGAYPYLTGGVSAWLHQLIHSMPDVEFILQVISAKRDKTRKFKYEIPENVVEIQEVYLMDEEYIDFSTKKNVTLTQKEYNAFESLVFGKNIDWESIFDFFHNNNVTVNSLLAGMDFYNIVASLNENVYTGVPFTEFFWSIRSMYLPLFSILNSNMIKADVYHSLSSGYAAILGSMQKRIYGNPYFLTEHGLYSREREEEIIRADWVDGVYKDLWIEQFNKICVGGYIFADKVSSLFAEAREFQIEIGCNADKAVVIPNGVDAKRYENVPPKDAGDTAINIGAIARVVPIKDLKTMIVAFSYAKKQDPRLKLWIMGSRSEDPEYAEECKSLTERLNIEDVIFTGNIDVLEYIGKMDFLMLSSISEGQPLVILEAYAAKKPFIATNVGNCKGLIEGEFDSEGSAGYVVPVTDSTSMAYAILNLAKDENVRKKMGEVGYYRAIKYYDKTQIYNKYLAVYKDLVDKNMTQQRFRR